MKELSTQDVADMLHVSKSTIYELIRRNELTSYKVGRKIRFSEQDVTEYIEKSKKRQPDSSIPALFSTAGSHTGNDFILCGQDMILDVLSSYLRQRNVPALRAYIGSYDSLIVLYRKEVKVASAHMWDSDADVYNTPYVRRLLPGIPTVVLHLTCRMQGLYVKSKNPKNITQWSDFAREDIVMVNRELGAGSRVLLDENLRLLGIRGTQIAGYQNEIPSHLAVASTVASGKADVAIGSEKIARQVDGIEFIPMKKERYDLVFREEDLESSQIQTMLQIIQSAAFQDEFSQIGGYDTTEMGKIVARL